ncbi:MAG: hypothetical protein HY327_09770 [Chloroflexi bacterium]|nr:hypothetical protein [Chloroflexota bacterium]
MHSKLETAPRIAAPFDRISVLTGFVMIGLTLSLLLDLPANRIDLEILGSEASIPLSGTWLLALVLAALTAAGVDSIVRMHPHVHLGEARYIFILWILPALIVVTATILLTLSPVRVFGLISVAFAGALVFAAVLGEFFSIDTTDRWYRAARLGTNFAVYLIALILFAAIYGLKLRSLFSSTIIAIGAGLLALELLRGAEQDFRRTWLYAAVVGLALGELAWAFNYWNLTGFTGGALLLIFFYVLVGLVQQYLWKRLNPIVLLEFAMIVVAALGAVFFLHPA